MFLPSSGSRIQRGTPKFRDAALSSFTSSLHGEHICIFQALNPLTIIQANNDGSGKGRIRGSLKIRGSFPLKAAEFRGEPQNLRMLPFHRLPHRGHICIFQALTPPQSNSSQ